MRKIVLLILLTLITQAEPLCENINLKKIKNLYTKELKNSEPFLYHRKDAFCQYLSNSSLAIVFVPYKDNIEEEVVYSLSFIIALVDVKKGRIKEHFYQ